MSESNNIIIAIDGGGSKVSAAAISVDEALERWPCTLAECPRKLRIEGTGSAGESSWQQASQHLLQAVDGLCEQFGCGASQVSLLLLALSGAGRQADRTRVLQWATTHPVISLASTIEVIGDIDPLVDYQASWHKHQPSLAVIVGTGSIVASRGPGGTLVRAGGWGPVLGDQASGWGIARDALRVACEWLDGATDFSQLDELVRYVMQQLNFGALDSQLSDTQRSRLAQLILNMANDRQQAAQLATGVLNLADVDRDSKAARIVSEHVTCLTQQIMRVHARCNFSSKPWDLVLSGGLLRHHSTLRSRILSACEHHGITPSQVCQVDPLVAALQMATRLVRKSYNPRGDRWTFERNR